MQNNLSNVKLPDKQRSHIVYQFVCSVGDCSSSNNSYIGLTNCTLLERLNGHKYKGSIFEHFRRIHNKSPTVAELVNSSKILYFCDNRRYLPVYEALFIKKLKPNLNENLRDFSCLKLNISQFPIVINFFGVYVIIILNVFIFFSGYFISRIFTFQS